MSIINLTQHPATEEQMDEGVKEPKLPLKNKIEDLLNFGENPPIEETVSRSKKLAEIASTFGAKKAMIGGAPFLMPSLTLALQERGIKPVCAFSKRESTEKEINGEVVKTSKFKHLGFVDALPDPREFDFN